MFGSMLAKQNTKKIRLYSEISSVIMFCICCFTHKGENEWTFSKTYSRFFLFALYAICTDLRKISSETHVSCRISRAFRTEENRGIFSCFANSFHF